MSFVNEYISPEDFDRYRIDLLNKRPRNTAGTAPSDVWTIDRSTGTWLRRFCEETDPAAPNARLTGVSLWDFHWGGEVMQIKLLLEDATCVPTDGMRRKKLLELEISSTLARFQWQVLLDLDVALNTYVSTQNRIEIFELSDGQRLVHSQVDALVQAMAAFAPPPPGQTTLTPAEQSALAPVIAANWN